MAGLDCGVERCDKKQLMSWHRKLQDAAQASGRYVSFWSRPSVSPKGAFMFALLSAAELRVWGTKPWSVVAVSRHVKDRPFSTLDRSNMVCVDHHARVCHVSTLPPEYLSIPETRPAPQSASRRSMEVRPC